MPFVRFQSLWLVFLVLSACSQSEANKADEQVRAALSWAATAAMTLDAWRNGTVPSHYARRTSRTARENILELINNLEHSGLRGPVQDKMRQMGETLGEAETGVALLDQAAVQRGRDALAATASSLRASTRSP